MIQYLEEFYKVTVEHLLHFREESPCKMHNIPGHAIYQKMMRDCLLTAQKVNEENV